MIVELTAKNIHTDEVEDHTIEGVTSIERDQPHDNYHEYRIYQGEELTIFSRAEIQTVEE